MKKFRFGDKVTDWVDKRQYIVEKKMRGPFYQCLDRKLVVWRINELRLKKGWKKVSLGEGERK